MADNFRWKQSRENLLSPSGIRLFQLAYAHRGENYESARKAIESSYAQLSPRLAARGGENNRHGGSFINFITLLEELGLMYRKGEGASTTLESTPAGDQMAVLLTKVPDALRVVPYFLLDVLARYSLNNPLNEAKKDAEMREMVRDSDMFPYWTLFKIMRSVGDFITKDELQRFVFKLHRMNQIDGAISSIRQYRRDQKSLTESELDEKYGKPIDGAAGQPKYIMGRAGFQSGVIAQDGSTYRIERAFIPFIDDLLSREPQFEELDEQTWIASYGAESDATVPVFLEAPSLKDAVVIPTKLSPDDAILKRVKDLLLIDGYGGVLLEGPPGTGKSFYAREIALEITDGDTSRVRELQFHPSYQYDDFVEGFVSDGPGTFRRVGKHLLQMCAVADATEKPVVLVIDEFSRADPVRVMGEALTYMDGSLRGREFFLASGTRLKIPPNLLFLATMNPDDRSVDEMDDAMDRRWARVTLAPSADVLNGFLTTNGMGAQLRGPIVQWFQSLQDIVAIGHAYFRTVADIDGLERLWTSQLLHVVRKKHRFDSDAVERVEAGYQRLLERLKGNASPPNNALEGEAAAEPAVSAAAT